MKNNIQPISDADRILESKKINAINMKDIVTLCYFFNKQVNIVRKDSSEKEILIQELKKVEEIIQKSKNDMLEHIEWQKKVINEYDKTVNSLVGSLEQQKKNIQVYSNQLDEYKRELTAMRSMLFEMNKKLMEKDHVIATYQRERMRMVPLF